MKNQNENNNKSAEKMKEKPNADNFKAHALSLVERINKSGTLSAELKNVLFGAFAEIRITTTSNRLLYPPHGFRMIYDDEIVFVNGMTRNIAGAVVEGAVMNKAFNTDVLAAIDLYDILKELKNSMGNFRSDAIKNIRLFRVDKVTKKNGATVILDFYMSMLEQVLAMPRMDLVVERMRKPDFVSSYGWCLFDIFTAADFYAFRLYVNLKQEGGMK